MDTYEKQFLKAYFPYLDTIHVVLPNSWKFRFSIYFSIHFLPDHLKLIHCSFSFACNPFQVWYSMHEIEKLEKHLGIL